MYRSIWKAFFVLFFKPCLSTCFCLFKYSYCFYLILSHLTYKRKQMRMQTEIIISLMYSLILRETLLCWLWMPWLRNSTLQNRHSLSSQMWRERGRKEKRGRVKQGNSVPEFVHIRVKMYFFRDSSPLLVFYVGILALFMDTMNVKLKCMWLRREVRTLSDKLTAIEVQGLLLLVLDRPEYKLNSLAPS